MLKSRIGTAGIVLCALLLGLPAIARAQAGNVIFAAGDVRLINAAGQARPAVKGETVSEGETMVSAPGASAQLRMKDGAYIALRSDSRLRVDTYNYQGREDGSEQLLLSLLKGGFRTITGLIGRTNKSAYLVRTPTATIGIRGTDHEPLYIAPPAPGETAIGPHGTYDKVNVGVAYIQTPVGSVEVHPNQVGFAAPGAVPQVLPRIPDFFRATGAPAPSAARRAEQADAPRPPAQRESVAADTASTAPAPVEVASLSAPAYVKDPEPTVVVTGTSAGAGTVDLTAQTVTDPSGGTAPIGTAAPTGIVAVTSHLSAGGLFSSADSFTFSTALTRDPATNAPTGFSEQLEGLKVGFQLVSPTSVAPAISTSPVAGIDYGRWSGGSIGNSLTLPLGNSPVTSESFVNLPRWGYAPEGYLDAAYQPAGATPLGGTFAYKVDAATTPIDSVSGQIGTLNNANTTLTADFTLQKYSANLDLTMGAQQWTASATNQNLVGNSDFVSGKPLSPLNTLTVNKVGCTSCLVGGTMEWGFTGQNYRGVLLAYNLFEQQSTTGSFTADIGGTIAFTRNVPGNPAISDATASPTGTFWVSDTGGVGLARATGSVTTIPTANGPMLSAYTVDFGSGNFFNVSTSAGTTGTVLSAPDTGTGIVLGTWETGSTTLRTSDALGTGQLHWALGPEVSPLYLPQAQTGTLTYSLDAATAPTNQAGVAGTLNTASMLVNFTKQTVDVGLNLTVNAHNWVASAAGMRLDGTRFESANAVTPMTVAVDPAGANVAGSGEIGGSLTGTGLNGAAVSYAMDALIATTPEAVNGVVAFSALAQNTAAPYRIVGEAGHTLTPLGGLDPRDSIGGEFNAAARVAFDTGSNLTAFDSRVVSGTSGSQAVAVTRGTASPAEFGSDSTTGISWGRWSGGTIDVSDRAGSGTATSLSNPGSLHWIAGPEMTGPVVLPTSGTFAYTKVGNTTPTDLLGNVGALNSATLTANFTAMTVDARVNATVSGTTLDGLAQAMTIMPRGNFGTESGTGTMTVTCAGATSACGTTQAGAMGGAFTGATGDGAALLYHLTTSGGPLTNPVAISGAAAFKR